MTRGARRLRGVMRPWHLVVLVAVAGRALAAQGMASPAPARWVGAPNGAIAVGDTVRDSLRKGDVLLPAERTYARAWRLTGGGTAGETVTIDVMSDAFDAYVFLLGPGLDGQPPQDDDSGGRCNARLTVRLPAAGGYDIVVTSTEQRATGAFTVTVTGGAKPKSLAPCDR